MGLEGLRAKMDFAKISQGSLLKHGQTLTRNKHLYALCDRHGYHAPDCDRGKTLCDGADFWGDF
jgi:hypothetical protein